MIEKEVHPHGVVTKLPLEDLIPHFNKLFMDELDDYPTKEEKVEHLQWILSECILPRNYFGIYALDFFDPPYISLHQLFHDPVPPNHQELLLAQLQHQSSIIKAASDILDKFVEIDLHDKQGQRDFLSKEFTANPEASIYFIKFQLDEGDDTAFDYHTGFILMVMETLIEALS